MSTIQIIPTSSLDWPSTLEELPRTKILVGGPSFLAYASHSRPTATPLSQFNRNSGHDATEVSKKEASKESSQSAIDLTKLSDTQLDELNYYQILGGIKMHSSGEEVKRAFHKQSLKYHPDKEDPNSASVKNKKGKEDPIFLKVKEAFDTLSDLAKRKAYDSTIDFDESIPETDCTDKEFYQRFGKCFERNLRFAVENDPSNQTIKNNANKKGRNKGKGGGGKHSHRKSPPTLGNDKTPISDVNEFYDYWIHFDSWRDFTIPAMKLTEHDTDVAGCRFEKRWMQQEIARKAKALKKDEMARIAKIVERSMASDPRLKREKIRIELEKEEKIRLRKERLEKEETERKNKEEKELKELAEREEREKEERARVKATKEQGKKALRNSRKSLRKLVSAVYEFEVFSKSQTWESTEDMNNDLELLCEKLAATEIDSLAKKLSVGEKSTHAALIIRSVEEVKVDGIKKVQEENRKRQARRLEAEQKEAAAKAARSSKPWSSEELSALAKAVRKYPAGGANRWETIALFINNLCRLEEPRSKEECIEKYNQANVSSASVTLQDSVSSAPKVGAKNTGEWTQEQNEKLQVGLSKYPASMEKNERWSNIAKLVPGRTKKECVQRFKTIRGALKRKK